LHCGCDDAASARASYGAWPRSWKRAQGGYRRQTSSSISFDPRRLRHGPGRILGKEGPELVAERARAFGDPSQTLVFGANTYRLMQRFHAESSDPGSRRSTRRGRS
jgi:hypothetical protein